MAAVEVRHLIEDDLGQQRLGADGVAVVQPAAAQRVRVAAEAAAFAQGRAGFLQDAEQHRDVLITVQAVGDEKRHHDDVRRGGQAVPFGQQRRLLHVGVHHLGEAVPALADQPHLLLDGAGGVFVQAGAVANDDETGLSARHAGSDLIGALQQQLFHVGVNADRVTVKDRLPVAPRHRAVQPQFARQHFLAEVTLADEVRDDVDDIALHHLEDLAHVRLLFPEAAGHLGEQAQAADGVRVRVGGGAGVRVERGPVPDQDQGGVRFGGQRQGGGFSVGDFFDTFVILPWERGGRNRVSHALFRMTCTPAVRGARAYAWNKQVLRGIPKSGVGD